MKVIVEDVPHIVLAILVVAAFVTMGFAEKGRQKMITECEANLPPGEHCELVARPTLSYLKTK